MGSRSLHGMGQFLGWAVRPIEKHGKSLLRCTQQTDHPVLNNGTTCDAAFCQTSLTTCFFDAFTQLLSFSDLVKTHGGPNKSGPLHLAVQTIRVPNKFA